jgi:hypothetical protein
MKKMMKIKKKGNKSKKTDFRTGLKLFVVKPFLLQCDGICFGESVGNQLNGVFLLFRLIVTELHFLIMKQKN